MKRSFKPLSSLALACALLAGAAQAGDRPGHRHDREGTRFREHEEMTLEDAVSRVRRRVEGRVLSAEEHDGEYRVRVLTPEGRVKRFRLDRRSGRFR